MSRARDLADSADKDIAGTLTLDGLTVAGNVSVDGGTIKLDGNYPVGTYNVALGDAALDANPTGGFNVAVGTFALTNNTSGGANTAVGQSSMDTNTTGGNNAAFGQNSLKSNTTGGNNTAVGKDSLRLNTTASNNTAVGYQALYANTTGAWNTAIGNKALDANTTAHYNTAIGREALSACNGEGNTAVGYFAGGYITSGQSNTFIGKDSGWQITTGSKNSILGRYNGNQGGLDIRTSSNNIVLSDGDGNPRLYCNSSGQWFANTSVASSTAVEIYNSNATSPYGVNIQLTGASPDNNSQYLLNCADSTATRMRVWSDGDVVNHDNSYGAVSDEKLKEQITDASSQWNDIKALTVRKYKMKSDVTAYGDSDDLWRLGVVAQEVETAGMSGLVKESPDLDPLTNEDLGTTTKEVKYSILYMKAVKALQEAMERIETLEAKVSALESA